MRRLIAAAVLLLLLAGIIIGGRVLTEKSTKAFGEKISLCEAEYKNGNKKTAALKAAEIKADWDKDQAYWAFYKGDTMMPHGVNDENINGGESYRFVYTK